MVVTNFVNAPQQNVIDLRKYFSIININKWRILSMAALVTLLAVLIVLNIKSEICLDSNFTYREPTSKSCLN